MATGSGKTYTAVTEVYRLAKFAKVKRVLFLVDRGNLATNAKDEFEQFVIPHDGRKFTQHYNVNILGRAGIPDATKVTISTIQRLYSQLTNQELDDEADEHSGFEIEGSTINKEPRPVSYNPDIPIEEFDVIIIDECHRSIYNLWRQVLEYFDAFLIGLTATPTKKTIGFFGQNLVSEYTHEDAVVDKVNVGYDIYRIKTELTEQGNKIEAGTAVEIRDRLTKQKRLEVLDQEEEWLARQLDRSVLAPNQIRTVIQAYKDRCLPECFPERNWNVSLTPSPLPKGEGSKVLSLWERVGVRDKDKWNGSPKPSSSPKTTTTATASSMPCAKSSMKATPSAKRSPTKSAKKPQKNPSKPSAPIRNTASPSPST